MEATILGFRVSGFGVLLGGAIKVLFVASRNQRCPCFNPVVTQRKFEGVRTV